jgi:hypothetical protein
MRLVSTAALSGAALSCLVADGARAGTIDVTDAEVPNNETITISNADPVLSVTAYTGQIVHTTSIGILNVWCIDLYHDIASATSATSHTRSARSPRILMGAPCRIPRCPRWRG